MVLVSGFVGIQFIPANPNQTLAESPDDIISNYKPDASVSESLKTSCYDCHSNNTRYPWYSKIQPVRFLMDRHVNEGKEELNFSEFTTYSKRKQKSKLKSIINQIKDGEMPLRSYTVLHRDAILTEKEKTGIVNWAEKLRDSL
jgi:hypothetical protein